MKRFNTLLAIMALALIGGCGGGGSGGGATQGGATSLSGVAASGAAISGQIFLKDAAGHEREVDTTDGRFTFPLAGLTAPFMLKALWTVNNQVQTLYSFATAGGTANITPLTQVVVMAAAKTVALDAVYGGTASDFATVAAALPAAVADVQGSLNPLLAAFSLASADPITTAFAPDHTGMDALLDGITVSSTGTDVVVTDSLTGSLILQAPVASVASGMTAAGWSAQDADVAYDPDVAVSSAGVGLIAWSEKVGGNYVIRTRFLDNGDTAPVTVNVSTAGDASDPKVAFDGSGNALLVWMQYQNARATIWGSRYAASTRNWSTPVQISAQNPAADVRPPVLAVDNAGDAVVTWIQGDGRVNHFDAWAAFFAASGGQMQWSAPVLISDGVNSVRDSRVALNATGQGLLVWQLEQDDGSTSNGPADIWGRTVTAAGVLGTPTRLNAITSTNTFWVDAYDAVAVDANGNGMVLFVQNGSSLVSAVHAAMFAGGHWQTSAPIATSLTSGFRFPQVAFDGLGNAFAVWQEQPLIGGAVGSASRYVAGVGWDASPHVFADNSAGNVFDPRLALDAAGNASIIWYQWQQTPTNVVTVDSIRYLADTGWGARTLVSPTSMDGAMAFPVPRVAANAAGKTLAVWGIFTN